MIKIYNGDCLAVISKFKDKSFDAIICDPPYGTTACKWDKVVCFDCMWKQLKRVVKDKGAIVLFGSEPFSSALRMSNIKNYKYDWVWDKVSVSNPQLAKFQPLKHQENILVFSYKTHNYYPQDLVFLNKIQKTHLSEYTQGFSDNKDIKSTYVQKYTNYPKAIIKYNRPAKAVHPTQKPVALMEYLIKTYTNEGEIVLDFTMGSGTTLVACKRTNRNGIGIEQDKKYCEIAIERLKNETSHPTA